MKRGYAHEVGGDALNDQTAALTAYGCEEVLVEREAGDLARVRLDEYLYNLRQGDELVVASVDVFARTTGKLITILHNLVERGVSVTALVWGPRTLDADGPWKPLQLLEVLAEHEGVRMHQRFRSRERGAPNSRRLRLDKPQAAEALRRFEAGESLASIARFFEVDPRVVGAALSGRRLRGEKIGQDGKVRARKTALKTPAFDIARLSGDDGNGD